MSSFSAWDRTFDPEALLRKEIDRLSEVVDTGTESVTEYRNSGKSLDEFYTSLEEDITKSLPPFDSENSYKVNDYYKHLLEIIRNCKKSKIALNNLSHVRFLLPWALQPNSNLHTERQSTSNLDRVLKQEILRAKTLSKAMKDHYSLRLVGQISLNHKKGLLWLFLAKSYSEGSAIEVAVYAKRLTRLKGNILLFDQNVNILLEDYIIKSWVYIKGTSICWIRQISTHQKAS